MHCEKHHDFFNSNYGTGLALKGPVRKLGVSQTNIRDCVTP